MHEPNTTVFFAYDYNLKSGENARAVKELQKFPKGKAGTGL
jgi:hypothetical protein